MADEKPLNLSPIKAREAAATELDPEDRCPCCYDFCLYGELASHVPALVAEIERLRGLLRSWVEHEHRDYDYMGPDWNDLMRMSEEAAGVTEK